MNDPTDPRCAFPPQLTAEPRPRRERVTVAITHAVQRGVAADGPPLDARQATILRRAIRRVVVRFVDRIADPTTPLEPLRDEFRAIGFDEAREGLGLEPLQTALRAGARSAWHLLFAGDSRLDLDMTVVARLGQAIFAQLDELVAASTEGYAEASALLTDVSERRRRLLAAILRDPPASPTELAELAGAADWELPRRVAAVALTESAPRDGLSRLALPPDALVDWQHDEPRLLVPDPDGPGRAASLAAALRGRLAAIGPAVPLDQAACSLRWARMTLTLARRGVIDPADGVIRCEEHLATLVILSDEELARVLYACRLAPLERLPAGARERLAETMLAWLRHGGNARKVGLQLHIHPQTVRYRMRRITDLFGNQLRDPTARFELEIALRARRTLATTPPPNRRASPGMPTQPTDNAANGRVTGPSHTPRRATRGPSHAADPGDMSCSDERGGDANRQPRQTRRTGVVVSTD